MPLGPVLAHRFRPHKFAQRQLSTLKLSYPLDHGGTKVYLSNMLRTARSIPAKLRGKGVQLKAREQPSHAIMAAGRCYLDMLIFMEKIKQLHVIK